MTVRLRKFWLDLKGSYWFLPTLFSLAALGLSVLTIWLDLTGAGWWFSGTGWLESSGAEGARSLLTVIASAMIAMASTVFAITIAAVAYASGNYGPRLLTNFMNDRGNQVALGTFIATFVYAVMVLRVVDSGGDPPDSAPAFIPQLSLFVATLMAAFAVAVLVYFLHHIPASIRINTVIGGIGRRLLDDIDARFPADFDGREPAGERPGEPVFPVDSGYVEILEFATLDEIAQESGATISLCVRAGDFVHPAIPLAKVEGAACDENLAKGICDAFAVGNSRTRSQDLEFLFDELVEIALRALSPGVNDPFTALSAVHWLGAATARLGGRDLCRGPEQDRYDPARVRPLSDDFAHFLARGFGALRNSAAASPIAGKMVLESLMTVRRAACTKERTEAVRAEARLLLAQAEIALDGPALDELRETARET